MNASTTSSNLRIGIVGAGYIADWHCQAIKQIKGLKSVAVADISLARAEQLAQNHGISEAYGSLEQMLSSCDLDAVHILTPPSYHLEAAAMALGHDVHAFLEKPMCATLQESEELAQIAQKSVTYVGVNHNFLYQPVYKQLKLDLRQGKLGRLDSVAITWNKPLPQISHGPFNAWMLEQPGNLILETGPHSVSHLLDLAGYPDRLAVLANDRVELPRGKHTYRHWGVSATCGHITAQLHFSFAPGFSEHYLHVRGSHGTAIVDFENNTYHLERSTRYSLDIDRYARVRKAGASLRKQAGSNLWQYIASKFHLSKNGNAYGIGIRESIEAFYQQLGTTCKPDRQQSADFGRDVLAVCEQIVSKAEESNQISSVTSSFRNAKLPPEKVSDEGAEDKNFLEEAIKENPIAPIVELKEKVLVLGGTGFIGQELVRQLVEAGYMVRLFCRNPANIGDEFLRPEIEVFRGDLTNQEDVDNALSDIQTVFHLARSNVNNWEDYERYEIAPTVALAKACVKNKVSRFIYTGTIDSYYAASPLQVITEDTPLDPAIDGRNYYARAKAISEERLKAMHEEEGLPLVIFRPGIVIGKGSSPYHWGVGMWSNDSCCQLWGNGENYLPFVLVEDVASALVGCLDKSNLEGESYNLVSMPCLTGQEYLRNLKMAAGVHIDSYPTSISKFYSIDMMKWVVKMLVRHHDRKMPSYRDWKSRTQLSCFNSNKARQELDWQPSDSKIDLVQRGIQLPVMELYGRTSTFTSTKRLSLESTEV